MLKTFFQRSAVRTLIALFGGQLVEAALAYFAGVQASWAPYAAAIVTALWNVYRNPSVQPVPPPPGKDGVVIRPL